MHHQIKVHLAQGHFGIEIGAAGEQITELPISRRLLYLPPELQPG